MFAQAPQRFTYQAVVRNESNTLVRGTVGVRISILQGGANGTMVYQETHTAVTNVNGLMTLEIGGGTVVNGDFASIDWANGPFFLKTEIDPTGGTYYVLENVQQLLSVPYALYAGSAANSFSGNYNDLTNTPDIPQIPENVSAFNNDAGYITMDSIPDIPTVPTNVSAFVNDAGYVTQSTLTTENYITQNDLITNNYVTEADIPTNVSAFTNDAGYITMDSIPEIPTVPTNVSAFVNDAGYVTQSTLTTENYITQNDLVTNNYVTEDDIPTNVSAFNNDAGYITMDSIPAIPTVPTNVSAFVNDAGYLTTATVQEAANIPTNVSAFNNDANYITAADVPAIPTNVSAFENDANYITSADVPAIPANVSAFTNDAGYLTSFTEQQVLTISNDTLFLTGGSFVKLPAGFDGNYNSLTNLPELFSGSYNDLTDKPTIPTVPANVSAFENDANYITAADVPAIPTNVSAFANDANYITSEDIPAYQVLSISNDTIYLSNGGYAVLPAGFDGNYNSLSNKPDLFSGSYNDLTDKPTIPTVPTNVSAFTNDANYITSADVPAIPTNVSSFTNDANYITLAQVPAQVNADWNATSGAAQIMNKPTIPTVPTNVSAFTNDANYITSADVPAIPTNVSAFTNDAHYLTEYTEQQVLSISNDTIYLTGGSFAKLPAGFSGSYNDLTDRPDIPTIPTEVSTFNNDAGYLTRDSLSNYNLNPSDIQALLDRIEELEQANDSIIINTAAVSYYDNGLSSGGNVISSGSSTILEKGVCWSTHENPTIDDNRTTDGSGLGDYISHFGNIVPSTTYYVRAYATNENGTTYGQQQSITTSDCPPSLTDIDGNVYATVLIGTQCWMRENLRTTRYADGSNLSSNAQPSTTTASWYYPNGSSNKKAIYGLLYNGKAIMRDAQSSTLIPSGVQGICPDGWHIPSNEEWKQMEMAVGMSQSDADLIGVARGEIAVKLSLNCGWTASGNANVPGNTTSEHNSSGFSAVPAGIMSNSSSVGFTDFFGAANFWTSTYTTTNNSQIALFIAPHWVYSQTSVTHVSRDSRFAISVRCLRDNLPTVRTASVSDITSNTAVCGGEVTSEGSASVTARGVCWSTSHNPTIADSHTNDGNGAGSFTSNINGLSSYTTYYVRAYATNREGTGYGEEVALTQYNSNDGQSCPSVATLTDIDGNTYNTVQIGSQCWMRENLKTTKYADGTSITNGNTTASFSIPYWYYPNNNSGNKSTYGLLYNWSAVMRNASSSSNNPSEVQGICPDGWHVPSDAEWTQLADYVSSQSQYICGNDNTNIGKALSYNSNWYTTTNYGECSISQNQSANNATGFGAMPAGFFHGTSAVYSSHTSHAYLWSSTENTRNDVLYRLLDHSNATLICNHNLPCFGYSVRCVKD